MNLTLEPGASLPSLPTGLASTRLGSFRILNPIGRGGMAMVYLAYQSDMDRLVALKVLFDHIAQDSVAVERFKREARVIASLEHPNIVPIYDFGQENEVLYLAMRYIRGGTVQDVMAKGRLPVPDISHLISDIAAALDYAHARGVIHRDIKPSNILVDMDGHAYLTDFGLAKIMDDTRELTHTSVTIGTPAYMSPEQALGLPITPQTDIYALGVMLYEMLTGEAPFSAETPMGVAMMHVQGTLRPPRELNPAIPPAIERVVMHAMAKEPAERYQSAGQMAAALAQAVDANIQAQPAYLPVIAAQLALGKEGEEVTINLRRSLRSQDQVVSRRRVLAVAPWIAAGLLVLGLAAVLVVNITAGSESGGVAGRTATAVALLHDQLNGAQTAIAAGAAGSGATLAYLQTRLAVVPAAITGSQETSGSAMPDLLQPSTTPIPSQTVPLAIATLTPFPTSRSLPTNRPRVPTATSRPPNTSVPPPPTSQPSNTPRPTATPKPVNTHKPPPKKP